MAKLEIKDVSKKFDETAVISNFSLSVSPGEFLVLLGPSGCGKSTLLRMIAGLEQADKGSILIDGEDVTGSDPRQRDIAMVFQNYALYPHMTVHDNIAFPLKMKKTPGSEIRAKVESTAEMLGLSEMLNRKPRTLSGGQRQRVAVGRAIVRDPRLFLFDEPLSNLDAKLRVSMRTEILGLMHSLGATVIYVTHDQEEALTMGDRIAVLNEGIIQQVGEPERIYSKPANEFIARFIGSPRMNLIPAILDNGEIRFNDGTVIVDGSAASRQKSQEIHIGFRPDECEITADQGISVAVKSIEYVGNSKYVHGEYGSEEIILETKPDFEVSPGAVLQVHPTPGCIHLFDSGGSRIE